MKLVTFAPPNAPPRAGALIDNGRLVVDLAASHRDTFGEPFPAFAQVLTIIEGVVMGADPRSKPLQVIDGRIRDSEGRGGEGSITLALWRITKSFVEHLYRFSKFGGPKPTGVNRHWILHGRDVVDWNRADSLRLFQAVDTLSSLSE